MDELIIKYYEALNQGINDSEMIEYLSDNSSASINDIIEFVNNYR